MGILTEGEDQYSWFPCIKFLNHYFKVLFTCLTKQTVLKEEEVNCTQLSTLPI